MLVAEMQITGSRGNGSVDYIAEYKRFGLLLLTEAKRERPDDGVVQNIARMMASRKAF